MSVHQLLEALGEIDDRFLLDVKPYRFFGKKPNRLRRGWILIAAVIAALALCGFAAYQLAVSDLWLQEPSQDPVETVKSAIENQMEKEYTLAVTVEQIKIDQEETAQAMARYRGSDLAKARGWDGYFDGHFVAVKAEYQVLYDHTKTFLDDGAVCQYFYLMEDTQTGRWIIVDNTTASRDRQP